MAGEVPPFHKNVAVTDFYELGDELGRGAFSVVKRGKHKATGTMYAVKIIQKKFVRLEVLEREITIMQKVSHPHVLSLKEVYEDATTVTLVLDLVTGGELFEKVLQKGHFSEQDSALIVTQILEALVYLHNKGVAHRDLKPENLLCASEHNMYIYVADFGLSRLVNEDEFQQMSTQCGSLEYCAPEILSGEPYDKSVDMWSLGVITYILLTGFFPFYDPKRDPAVLFRKIQNVSYDWEDCPEVSNVGKDFVAKLLVLNPKQRLTAEEALNHPWVSKKDNLNHEHRGGVLKNMLSHIGLKKKK